MSKGETLYEKITITIRFVIILLVAVTVSSSLYKLGAVISDYFFPAGEIGNELDKAEEDNKKAKHITEQVIRELDDITAELRQSASKTADISAEVEEVRTGLGSATQQLGEISTGIGGIKERVKKTERDLGEAGALVEESLSILEAVKAKSNSH